MDKPPRQPQTSKINRNGLSTMREIPKFNVPQTAKGYQEVRVRMNSTKTIETKDEEEDSYLRKREYQLHPFFRK